MEFKRSYRSHQHHGRRFESGHAAFDVDKFFSAQVGPETRFGDHIIGQFQRGFGGAYGVAAVSDIGKRPAVNNRDIVFQRLHQVGFDRIF